MGLGDKIGNAAEDAKGKAKEGFGDATDNEKLQARQVALRRSRPLTRD